MMQNKTKLVNLSLLSDIPPCLSMQVTLALLRHHIGHNPMHMEMMVRNRPFCSTKIPPGCRPVTAGSYQYELPPLPSWQVDSQTLTSLATQKMEVPGPQTSTPGCTYVRGCDLVTLDLIQHRPFSFSCRKR